MKKVLNCNQTSLPTIKKNMLEDENVVEIMPRLMEAYGSCYSNKTWFQQARHTRVSEHSGRTRVNPWGVLSHVNMWNILKKLKIIALERRLRIIIIILNLPDTMGEWIYVHTEANTFIGETTIVIRISDICNYIWKLPMT